MKRLLALAAVALTVVLSSGQAMGATVTRAFGLNLTTGANDFLSLGAGTHATQLELLFNETGDISGGRIVANGVFKANIVGGVDTWSVNDGGVTDSLVTTFRVVAGGNKVATFVLNNGNNPVSDLNTTIANLDAISAFATLPSGTFSFGGFTGYTGSITAVPEPASMAALGLVVLGAAGFRARRKKSA